MLRSGFLLLLFFCFSSLLFSQESNPLWKQEVVVRSADTLVLATKSLHPSSITLTTPSGEILSKEQYSWDATSGKIVLSGVNSDTLIVSYARFPEFLTKSYSFFDRQKIVDSPVDMGEVFELDLAPRKKAIPFEGLTTKGSISRGVTVGNNQNTVTSSSLDLQITGKLSDKVGIRASIQDSNIPIQEGGYSQKLDEFDQIFIELFSDKWNIRAGDVFLENRKSSYLNFNKKIQGLATEFRFGTEENSTRIFSSAALVRGQYARMNFIGQEANQGPYKLKGNNGELYVLVVSGSEKVYVNGVLLERGEDKQYVVDYNAGEITFTSLFPITSEMRISVEYQFSERSYSRFLAYGGLEHQSGKWRIAGAVYSESDIKNQPLQQSLSQEQIQILQQAGNDPDKMMAQSAYLDSYSENKILYKKELIDGVEVFVFSNNPEEELYQVKFTRVGAGVGNYILANSAAVGKIYQYVAPISGIPQGEYEPIVKLVAPEKIQLATTYGGYTSEKTTLDFELGVSNADKNLFSTLDDENNKGYAGKLKFAQRLLDSPLQIQLKGGYQYLDQNFKTIERLYSIEFDRDWNLNSIIPTSNQTLASIGLDFNYQNKGWLGYELQHLNLSQHYKGLRQVVNGYWNDGRITYQTFNSALDSKSNYADSKFLRSQHRAKYHFSGNWVGASLKAEDNTERLKATRELSTTSQRFTEYGAFIGRGDSLKVFAEVGILERKTDSIVLGALQRVSSSRSYYLKSRLLQGQQSELLLYANYRKINYQEDSRASESALNSRLVYNDRFWNQLLTSSTTFETTSGSIAQQEYTYLEVEPGQGVYMWIDYNGNGIQELEEFEVANFSDQAKYVRVFLPNQQFVKTHQNRFSQAFTLNFLTWQNEDGLKKVLSHFYNQSSYMAERKVLQRGDNFDFNPFLGDGDDVLGLQSNFRNSLFYNRGKQKHSTTYTFLLSQTKNLLSVGSIASKAHSHQLQYTHLIEHQWLVNMMGKSGVAQTNSENYQSRNYRIESCDLNPKLSYLFDRNTSLDVFYIYQFKENVLGDFHELQQNRFGLSFTYTGKKGFTASGEMAWLKNNFTGEVNSPVAYQMLEGLQPGRNTTWRLMLQKNLTQYLDLNLNYEGRKSENSTTIHTGNVQLRAFF